MSAKDQTKVLKLLAIALDKRGNQAECAAAGAKALALCREDTMSLHDLGLLLGSSVRPEFVPEPEPTAFEIMAQRAAERAVNRIFSRAFNF